MKNCLLISNFATVGPQNMLYLKGKKTQVQHILNFATLGNTSAIWHTSIPTLRTDSSKGLGSSLPRPQLSIHNNPFGTRLFSHWCCFVPFMVDCFSKFSILFFVFNRSLHASYCAVVECIGFYRSGTTFDIYQKLFERALWHCLWAILVPSLVL